MSYQQPENDPLLVDLWLRNMCERDPGQWAEEAPRIAAAVSDLFLAVNAANFDATSETPAQERRALFRTWLETLGEDGGAGLRMVASDLGEDLAGGPYARTHADRIRAAAPGPVKVSARTAARLRRLCWDDADEAICDLVYDLFA